MFDDFLLCFFNDNFDSDWVKIFDSYVIVMIANCYNAFFEKKLIIVLMICISLKILLIFFTKIELFRFEFD